jgi:hypothetical protein
MIPGSNLLNMALSVINTQTVQYYKAKSRTLNAVGQYVTSYDDPINVAGSFQPVPRTLYEKYGLDLQKDYFTFYVSQDLIDIQRDVSPDQIVFNSKTYQCLSANDWFEMDGWVGILCVLINGQAS